MQKSYCIAGIILRRYFFLFFFDSIPSPVWLSSISFHRTDVFQMAEYNKFHILFISTIKIYVCKHSRLFRDRFQGMHRVCQRRASNHQNGSKKMKKTPKCLSWASLLAKLILSNIFPHVIVHTMDTTVNFIFHISYWFNFVFLSSFPIDLRQKLNR